MLKGIKQFWPCMLTSAAAFAISAVRCFLWVDPQTGYDGGPASAVFWCAVLALCAATAAFAAITVRRREPEARPPKKAGGIFACIGGALYIVSAAAGASAGPVGGSKAALWTGRAGLLLSLAAGLALVVCGASLVRSKPIGGYAAALLTVPVLASVRTAHSFLSSIINGADTVRVLSLAVCLVSALCTVKIVFAVSVDSIGGSLGPAVVFALFSLSCAAAALPAVPLMCMRGGVSAGAAALGDVALCAFGAASAAACRAGNEEEQISGDKAYGEQKDH